MELLDWKGSEYCLTDFFRKGGEEGTPKIHQKTGILLNAKSLFLALAGEIFPKWRTFRKAVT